MPAPLVADQTPSALLALGSSVKVFVMIDKVEGMIERGADAHTRPGRDQQAGPGTAAHVEPAANAARPATKVRLRPIRSARLPATSSRPPNTST